MSKVVFVGNVPYSMGEEQLIDVFKSVGQVVGFRLVFDRETGKPRGYGFCEFADHETAASAVRNLNNTDVGGRSIRIDLADSDPFLEGKTTVRGELVDGGYPGPSEPRHHWRSGGGSSDSRSHDFNSILAALPSGVQVPNGASALDYITETLVGMQPSQLMEVLAQMKAFIINHPDHARQLLIAHPELAHALFQALVMNNIVDSSILQRMIAASTQPRSQPSVARPPMPPPHVQPPPSQYPPTSHPGYPPPPPPVLPQQSHPQPLPGHAPPPPMPGPQMYSHQQPPPRSSVTPANMPPPMPSYYVPPPSTSQPPAPLTQAHQPPPQQSTAPANQAPSMSEEQRAMLMQVFNMTQEQINAYPDNERSTIQQLRSQYSQYMGNLGA